MWWHWGGAGGNILKIVTKKWPLRYLFYLPLYGFCRFFITVSVIISVFFISYVY